MESANLHQQQNPQLLQDHHQLVASSNSHPSPCFSLGNNYHAATPWRPPNFLLNNDNNIHASSGEAAPDPLLQELSFANWHNNVIDHSAPHLISNKIKQESSNEMILLKALSPANYKNHLPNNSEELQLSSFQQSVQFPTNDHDNLPSLGCSKGMTTFSQIFPSVNISNSSNNNNPIVSHDNNDNKSMSSFVSISSFMEMKNLQDGSDLFVNQAVPSRHLIELIKGGSPFGVELDHKQQSSDLKLWQGTNNFSPFNNNGVSEPNSPSCCIVEPKSTHRTAFKKPRFESRASCPPLKVRKEKLGDRIAALQQLVAPFGKTDTASVLMEAIGYIKFLQNQVETLSVPYMKLSSRNKNANNIQRVSDEDGDSGEPKQDLRSRGLCLVPTACMSYLASDASSGHSGVWPPSNFNPSF